MTVRLTVNFTRWFVALRDERAQARIADRIARLETGLFGDAKRFDGLVELRIDYGPGYRLYAAERGGEIILLLCGGDKGSQRRDISTARAMLAALD